MYGKLYLAQRVGGGSTYYYYGPNGSNLPGQWLHWKFEKQGSQLIILVDGQPVSGIPVGIVVDGSRIFLPGLYEDGDGLPHVGFSSSTADNFSISVSGSPLDRSTWGQIKALYYGN